MFEDLVLVLMSTTIESSLLARWQGLFPLMEKISTTTYHVRTTENRKIEQIIQIYMIALWHYFSAICIVGMEQQVSPGPICYSLLGQAKEDYSDIYHDY